MKAAILLALFGLAACQTPRPCTSPPQWEGREDRLDYSQKYFERRRIFYDETEMRVRTIAEVLLGDKREHYDVLELHRENKMYSFSYRTQQCNVSTLDRPFHYRGVHPDAKFQALVTLGAPNLPGEGVQAAIFSANETSEYYVGTVSVPDCIPIRNIHITQKYGYEHSDYFDITAGISDPMAFVPPPECNKSH